MPQPQLRIIDNYTQLSEQEQLISQVSQLASYFADNTDCIIRKFHYKQIALWLRQGFQDQVIRAAMAETFAAPAPSWRYLAAIMSSLISERCFTLERWHMRSLSGKRGKSEFYTDYELSIILGELD